MRAPEPDLASSRSTKRSRWELVSFAFVLLVWLAAWIHAHAYVASYASRIPFLDDTSPFALMWPNNPPSLWEWLWGLHNEHRVVAPKLVQLALLRLTHDIRSGMHAQAVMYAACALACVLGARRVRPGSRPWDAFFPLMWLQTGNTENLLMGFQVCVAIAVTCVCVLFFASVVSTQRLRPARVLASSAALSLLPFCAGMGIAYTPVFAAWIAWLGWTGRKSVDARERTGARVLLASAAFAVVVMCWYFVDYETPAGAPYATELDAIAANALAQLSVAFGPRYLEWWPVSGYALGATIIVVAYPAGARVAASRGSDPTSMGLLAALGACCGVALGMSYARPPTATMEMANRYIPLTAPFFAVLHIGSLVLLPQRLREVLPVAMFAAMLHALPSSIAFGKVAGETRLAQSSAIETLVSQGAEARRVHSAYTRAALPGNSEPAAVILGIWQKHGLAPFDRGARYAAGAFEMENLCAVLLHGDSKPRLAWRTIDGNRIVRVPADTVLRFAFEPEHTSVSGSVIVPWGIVARGTSPGVHLTIERVLADGTRETLGTLFLDPVRREEDRGWHPFEFTFPAGEKGEIALRFECPDKDAAALANGSANLRTVFVL